MKTSLLALILLLFGQVAAFPEKKTDSGAVGLAATPTSVFWPPGSTVNVYFVSGLFTSGQRHVLLNTLESWTQNAQANSTIKFLYAGETGGLIDCRGCLTLTRQEVYTNDPKRLVSFNRLRGDQAGQLISAWIGFDSAITDSQKLRALLARMLGESRRFLNLGGQEVELSNVSLAKFALRASPLLMTLTESRSAKSIGAEELSDWHASCHERTWLEEVHLSAPLRLSFREVFPSTPISPIRWVHLNG